MLKIKRLFYLFRIQKNGSAKKITMQISKLFIPDIILQKRVISWCKNMATCETNCFLFYKDADGCGDFKREGELVPLSECNADISAHLRRCHLSKECLTEKELILMRSGYFCLTEQQVQRMMVCPRHRANLGQYWGNQTRKTPCQYPEHKGKIEGVKSDRAFTVKLEKEVKDLFGVIVPVGSREYFSKNQLQ